MSSIWLQIFPPKSKPILLNGYYRQWNLPKTMRNNTSDSNKNQIERYDQYLKMWKKAIDEKKDTIIIGDDNIDTLNPDLNTMNSHNKKLYLKLTEQIEDTNMVISNYEPTFGIKSGKYSTIDHIYNNCPKKIINITTLNNNFTDHQLLRFMYLTKAQVYRAKFKYIRNTKLLNANTLQLHVQQSQQLNKLFTLTDPNKIANFLQNELSLIIDTIAPQKRIQVKNIHSNFLTPNIVAKINNNNKLLTKAINSKKSDDWLNFKNDKISLNTDIKKEKIHKMKSTFKHNKNKWKKLKSMIGNDKQCPPNKIIHNNRFVTSPKKIAEACNAFFKDKVENIRKHLPTSKIDPIFFLNQVFQKNENKFTIPYITIEKTKKIINNLNSSNSTGHDNLSSKTLKKIKNQIAPHITHLINAIIRTSVYPDIYKLSRILPLCKPGMDPIQLSSYRPINNLPCIEKIIEEYFIECLNDFFHDNKILHKNHHGSRRLHSPTTALTQINSILYTNKDNKNNTVMLATDLSAAFDTIDHSILLRKLEFYGIRENFLKLFESFLSYRKSVVELETFSSSIIDQGPYSCIQGSKMSGLLYNIYTNEVPEIKKLMDNPEKFKMITGRYPTNTNIIDHTTINYVDDSSHVVTFDNNTNIKDYLENFFLSIHIFYVANILKINTDKTKLIFFKTGKNIEIDKNFYFMANTDKITPKSTLLILGFMMSSNLSTDNHINMITPNINHRINTLKQIQNVTDEKTRLQLANSLIIGKLNHVLPLLSNISEYGKTKIHKIVMTSARFVIGQYGFKWSCKKILDRCNWPNEEDMIKLSSLKFIHTILKTSTPTLIHNYFKLPNRSCSEITLKLVPKTKISRKFFLYKYLKNYNNLPSEIKTLNKVKFKFHAKFYVMHNRKHTKLK